MPHKPAKQPRKLPLESWKPGKRIQISLPPYESGLLVALSREHGNTPTGLNRHLIRLAAGGRTKPGLPVNDTTRDNQAATAAEGEGR